ncbi:MAG: type VI secretion system contractile sheath small subunit [Myxococcales bacterium]|jgi:type VI secretion system protein ImpB|nr:type VI secretion system contractile sheath small subunit [Myxococcales bacterium]
MSNSTQHKLDRIRPPRVQITYDVETGGAIEKKELPMVVGILADLSGHREEALPKIKERKFTQIDRDNFNDVMKSTTPRLKVTVDNKIAKDGGRLAAELKFQNIDDFHPVNVAKQVEPLNKLLSARQRLVDLVAKLDGNDALADELRAAASPDMIAKLREEALKN